MAKRKTVFFCKECGFESSKWLGQCPGCKQWDTFVEEPVVKKSNGATGGSIRLQASEPTKLSSVVTSKDQRPDLSEIKQL